MKQKRIRTVVLFVFAIALGGLGGVIVRSALFPPNNISNPQRGDFDLAGRDAGSLLSARDAHKERHLTALKQLPSTEQILWIASQAERGTAAEMAGLTALAKAQGFYDLERAVAARWATLAPKQMFETVKTQGRDGRHLLRVLYEVWVKTDPQTALDTVAATREEGTYTSLSTSTLANELMKEAPAVGIQALRALGLRHFSPTMKNVSAWAAKNPRLAAEQTVRHMNADFAGRDAMEEIGKAWAKQAPETALAFAAELNPGHGFPLAEGVIRSWMEQDPEAAAAYTAGVDDPALRASMGEGLVEAMAESDPEMAMAWADEHLMAASRTKAISQMIKAMGKEDAQAAAGLVSGLRPGGAKNKSARELVHQWAQKSPTDEALLGWIGTLETDAREQAMDALEWRLQQADKSWAEFVSGEHGHLAGESMMRLAANERVRQDPESAIRWAQALPEDRSEQALEAVMKAWRQLQPKQAAAWETSR